MTIFHIEGQRGVRGSSALVEDEVTREPTRSSFPNKRLSGSTSSSSSTIATPSPKSLHTDSPPDGALPAVAVGTSQGLLSIPKPDGVLGVFVNDCPPSPQLTKSLLAHAQTRKRAGRHTLVPIITGSSQRVLRLPEENCLRPSLHAPVDRQAISNDIYESLLSAANQAKKNGQHKMLRRRQGLSGDVESVLVLNHQLSNVSTLSCLKKSYSSLFSPDPALF